MSAIVYPCGASGRMLVSCTIPDEASSRSTAATASAGIERS
ncbi:hypothetical protein [Microbacterium arabinogalactanolyticum]